MPRTKVSKNSKRNRDTAVREEKIREFDRSVETYLDELDFQAATVITDIESELNKLIERTNDAVLDELLVNINKTDINKIGDSVTITANSSNSSHSQSQFLQSKTPRVASVNDDGYITEDSANSGCSSALTSYLSMTQRGRTPGPLESARARRQRRSRSACSDNLTRSIVAPKPNTRNATASEHASRNKLRTPMSKRTKALSADRTLGIKGHDGGQGSPVCAFLRWPKPGEFVMSVHGSPLVAPAIVPDRFANVNIPIKDGILSLRPKRLATMDSDIVDKFDAETLHQIKTLHENLDLIVSLASKNNK